MQARKEGCVLASLSSWAAATALHWEPPRYAHKECRPSLSPDVQEIRYVCLGIDIDRASFTTDASIGDIVHLSVFGQSTVVIDSYDAAIELLEHRSAQTSDRSRLVMAELSVLALYHPL